MISVWYVVLVIDREVYAVNVDTADDQYQFICTCVCNLSIHGFILYVIIHGSGHPTSPESSGEGRKMKFLEHDMPTWFHYS